MSEELLKLPLEIQIALGSGYAAYMLAYTGLRGRHKNVEVLFLTVVFGLAASAVMIWLSRFQLNILYSGAVAFLAACFIGVVWRKYGRKILKDTLAYLKITWSDDAPSALASITENSEFRLSQIAVELDDGTWLQCNDASKFRHAPFGPVLLGPNGDLALYLTHIEKPDQPVKELSSVFDPKFGYRITYVPAARIKRITFRHAAKT